MPSKLTGIYTPTLVPIDQHGDVNEDELRRFLDWLIVRGVDGVYPNGSTGEFTRLTAEERRRIVKITCEVAKDRVPVLAGAAEANVRETVAACETYAEYGARAVAIVAPFYYRLSAEAVYAYFADIAKNSPIDVTLYNIPMFASPIDVPTIRRLAADFPRIIGIKDSSGDLAFMMRMISAVKPIRPDFSFMTGWEAVLVPMLMIGCDGGTNASSNVVPELTRQLFEMCQAGKHQAAMDLQYRLTELFDVMLYQFEFPDGFRAAAEMRGFNFGVGRQPLSGAQRFERTELQRVLQCILSDFGLVDVPAGGCPPWRGGTGAAAIKEIVTEVLDELGRRGAL